MYSPCTRGQGEYFSWRVAKPSNPPSKKSNSLPERVWYSTFCYVLLQRLWCDVIDHSRNFFFSTHPVHLSVSWSMIANVHQPMSQTALSYLMYALCNDKIEKKYHRSKLNINEIILTFLLQFFFLGGGQFFLF